MRTLTPWTLVPGPLVLAWIAALCLCLVAGCPTDDDDDTSGDDDDACQLPAPEFEHVVDHLSQPVSPDTLLGHHTVMWFYPVAATSG